jgi:hypothetical protein
LWKRNGVFIHIFNRVFHRTFEKPLAFADFFGFSCNHTHFFFPQIVENHV